jgi:hypothetical protein
LRAKRVRLKLNSKQPKDPSFCWIARPDTVIWILAEIESIIALLKFPSGLHDLIIELPQIIIYIEGASYEG